MWIEHESCRLAGRPPLRHQRRLLARMMHEANRPADDPDA